MVRPLRPPVRTLQNGAAWIWQIHSGPWRWCRIYHESGYTPDGVTHRDYGPLSRMDHHEMSPDEKPRRSPTGRSVLYVAESLMTALGEVFGEVFGEAEEARVCPNYRVAILKPRVPIHVLDLRLQGAAMRIGALPSLATAPYPRDETQAWARAIYEDQPVAGTKVRGIYYDAAYSNGGALALWDTTGDVVGVSVRGIRQDFALSDPRMWPRVQGEANDVLRMPASLVARRSCPLCS
ncbi:RES family NAD+ phosphorylase [Specibacter cremeus]|uniref:RES family NAD+ phosphorylase n=1 Tax=Specibacter cremeus TaxID=1629051 RepID=UPI000F78D967|nr:RES family NAD+ phosphorylase [Specibacter cremeus]